MLNTMYKNCFTLPLEPPVGWAGGRPLPILLPLDAFGLIDLGAFSASFITPPPIQIPGHVTTRYAPPIKIFWLRH